MIIISFSDQTKSKLVPKGERRSRISLTTLVVVGQEGALAWVGQEEVVVAALILVLVAS